MKIFDRLILTIYSFSLAVLSFVFMLLPFDIEGFFSIGDGVRFLESIKGNYWYSLLGLVFLFFSIRFLLSGFIKEKDNLPGTFLVMRNEYGEIIIYQETIVGLTQYVVSRFTGIRNVKTKVEFVEGQINLALRGEVSHEVNIPETSKELQSKVKEHIENTIGANVRDIKLEIVNISSSHPRVK